MEEYKQTTDYTCAASSLLMVLNHFDPKIKLIQENEFDIWQKTVNLPTRASSIFGIANYASSHGIKTKIIMESQDYEYPDYRFKGYKKVEIETAEKMSRIQMEKAKENIPIIIKEFNKEELDKHLEEGKILLARLNAGIIRETKSVSQYLVIKEKKDDEYVIFDPVVGKKIITKDQLKEAIETLHTKKKRNNRILVFG